MAVVWRLQYEISLVAQTVRSGLLCGRPGFDPWVGMIPWRREWLSTPVFLPGEFHEQRSLASCSPWGLKELDMTEQLTFLLFSPWKLNTCKSKMHGFGPQVESGTMKVS